MEKIVYLIPLMGIVGMLFALYLAMRINKQDPGTERMKEISAAIHGGAKAFLFAEYRILVFFIIALFAAIGVAISAKLTKKLDFRPCLQHSH